MATERILQEDESEYFEGVVCEVLGWVRGSERPTFAVEMRKTTGEIITIHSVCFLRPVWAEVGYKIQVAQHQKLHPNDAWVRKLGEKWGFKSSWCYPSKAGFEGENNPYDD